MPKTGRVRISSKLRQALNKQLGSHAQAHAGHPSHTKAQPEGAQSVLVDQSLDRYRVLENLQAYTVNAAKAARTGLRHLERGGQLLLIQWPFGLLAQVEVHEREGQLTVTRMSSGAVAFELENAIQRVQQHSVPRNKHGIEIRILSVPTIHLVTVWKHRPTNAAKDRFVPVMRNFVGLKIGHPYSLSHIDAVIRRETTELIITWYERQHQAMNRQTST